MKLYVGNLDYNLDESQLQRYFEQYGDVASVKIITDKETGESKGFGFVEMADKEGGKKALERMNGSEVNGRRIKVNLARPSKNKYRR
jgi:RNA recognition motif-containing protein